MSKDDATWLNICYVVFALLIAYVAYRSLDSLGTHFGWTEKFSEWFYLLSRMGGLAVGIGSAVWCRASPERYEYHLASVAEIKKVVWPSFDDVKKMTMIVAVVVAIFSVILAIFDIIWSRILQTILP